MNYLLVAQDMQELTVASWLGPLLLLVTLACVTAWYIAINRRMLGYEPVTYADRKQVPWGADGAALAFMAVAAAAITFFSTTFSTSLSPDAIERDMPLNASLTISDEGKIPAQAVADFPAEVDRQSNASKPSNPKAMKEAPKINFSAVSQYATISALLVVLMIGWQRMQVCATWTDFGFPTSFVQLGKDIQLGQMTFAAALLPVYAVQFLLVSLLGAPSSHQVLEDLINDPTGNMLLVAGLMAVVIAPIFEEFSFRVMLQGWLEKVASKNSGNNDEADSSEEGTDKKQSKKVWPILVSSFAFAVAHTGQGYAPVALFVLACFLGYIYRQTHRLAPCVVAHMAFNALSLAMAFGAAPGLAAE